jgi:hypothetical protein
MNQRMLNECVSDLARRALAIIAPALMEAEHRDAYEEFARSFREALLWYEIQRERMLVRLGKMTPSNNNTTTRAHDGAVAATLMLEEQQLIVPGGTEFSREIIEAAMEFILEQQRQEMLREGVN